MALLQKLKEKLGIGGSGKESARKDTEVTVEHDPDEGAGTTDDEEPVDEPADEPVDETVDESVDESDDEPIATETEASASTESLLDEDEEGGDPAEAAEPAEAAGPESDEIQIDDEGDDSTAVDDDGEDSTAVDDGEKDGAAAVDSLKGIGPAYADRLSNIGIHTIDDLADADPAEVAEGANVGEKRAKTWIQRAQEF